MLNEFQKKELINNLQAMDKTELIRTFVGTIELVLMRMNDIDRQIKINIAKTDKNIEMVEYMTKLLEKEGAK